MVIGRHCPIGGHATCARGHTSRAVRDRSPVTTVRPVHRQPRRHHTRPDNGAETAFGSRPARRAHAASHHYRRRDIRRHGWGRRVSWLWCAAVTLSRSGRRGLGLVVDRLCSTRPVLPSAHSSPIGLRPASAQSFSCRCSWQRVVPAPLWLNFAPLRYCTGRGGTRA